MIEIKPPHLDNSSWATVFLAGSIDMGKAVHWQQEVVDALKDLPAAVFNPRRDDWDSSWKQTKDDPQFSEQVNWELKHLYQANVVFFYFAPGSASPISLAELGFVLGSNMRYNEQHIIVCCPEGFYRKGNVDIMCERLGAHCVYDDFNEAISALKLKFT